MPAAILDPFHRAVHLLITEEIERLTDQLVSGSAAKVKDDTRTVAENYAAAVAYISALRACLGICQSVADGIDPRPARVTVTER